MKTIIIALIFWVLAIIFIGKAKITFNPFSFEIPEWRTLVGLLFLAGAIGFFKADYRRKIVKETYIEAYKEGINDMKIIYSNLMKTNKTK